MLSTVIFAAVLGVVVVVVVAVVDVVVVVVMMRLRTYFLKRASQFMDILAMTIIISAASLDVAVDSSPAVCCCYFCCLCVAWLLLPKLKCMGDTFWVHYSFRPLLFAFCFLFSLFPA